MLARGVVTNLERREFSFEIAHVPERNVIQELAAHRANQAFDERMRQGHTGQGLDRLDLQDP